MGLLWQVTATFGTSVALDQVNHLRRIVFLNTKIPRLDNVALSLIDVLLILHILHANLHAVLRKDDVFLAHALRGMF